MRIAAVAFARVAVLWWAILWRSAVYGFGGALVVGVSLGIILGLIGASRETMTAIGQVAGTGVGVAACAFAGWSQIRKEIRGGRRKAGSAFTASGA